ncbi:hypothetical protein EOS_35595 [Caballeronia mineralivorans PML1(12)]|uniref:Uncharacterized protein n=1 Tax=Caballeronia mineralivorans PML1(12) TaxID=908627 RepID=A0A0J1FP22_9BURK|nr:hypothetical protein EOS_35595 [Caballeronia mineralivorans PML1(12)]
MAEPGPRLQGGIALTARRLSHWRATLLAKPRLLQIGRPAPGARHTVVNNALRSVVIGTLTIAMAPVVTPTVVSTVPLALAVSTLIISTMLVVPSALQAFPRKSHRASLV